ncbi:MAG: MaoC family dehydratase N-terminal domain-containing protein [Deltaproteobacteria bacterium]|nr:MaoC family dehydratase N-terminal domain-containing protein [Deltaproteobacteria bacterium]
MALLTDEHRRWIGREDAPVTVEVSRRDIVKYAVATDQLQEKYLRGDEAPPMFVFNLFGPLRKLEDMRADGLPRAQGGGPALPLKRVMAGGTELRMLRPIRAGDTLTATSRITDMVEKSGAQGPLIFTVRTTRITDASGALVLEEIQTAIAR